MKSRNQTGSAHVVVIIVLVVAVLGLLGLVFWQNFIQDTAPKESASASTSSSELTGLQTFTSQKHGITFDYPKAWTAVESVSSTSSDTWYSSQVKVYNDNDDFVASLGVGGQFGGTCDPESEKFKTNTLFNDEVTLPGIGSTHIGYTIVDNNDGTFGVAFGLNSSKYTYLSGEKEVQCPMGSVDYAYVQTIGEGKGPVGNVQFGSWYISPSAFEITSSLAITEHARFNSFDEAQAYASSDEFKQIQTMIKSLKIEV